jgi:RNA polymerase sigma-70 factor (ECF subfamily)
MVFSLALHLLREYAAAEDLAQDVFLELYRHLHRLQSAAHVRFWLRQVASRRCIDIVRRRASRAEIAVEQPPDVQVGPAERDPVMADRLRRLISTLPERARLVMILKYQEDLEPSEIAAVLGMPINTVKSHLRRSVGWLRAQLTSGGTA